MSTTSCAMCGETFNPDPYVMQEELRHLDTPPGGACDQAREELGYRASDPICSPCWEAEFQPLAWKIVAADEAA